jgi:hypothetical protein
MTAEAGSTGGMKGSSTTGADARQREADSGPPVVAARLAVPRAADAREAAPFVGGRDALAGALVLGLVRAILPQISQ